MGFFFAWDKYYPWYKISETAYRNVVHSNVSTHALLLQTINWIECDRMWLTQIHRDYFTKCIPIKHLPTTFSHFAFFLVEYSFFFVPFILVLRNNTFQTYSNEIHMHNLYMFVMCVLKWAISTKVETPKMLFSFFFFSHIIWVHMYAIYVSFLCQLLFWWTNFRFCT